TTQPVRASTLASSAKRSEVDKKPAAKPQPAVTLTLVRVRGMEFKSIHLEGEFKGKEVRSVVFACDVILDNNSGDDLTIQSRFFSAFDGLSLVVLQDGKPIHDRAYIFHQSPLGEPRAYTLKKGKNAFEMRIPVEPMAENWPKLHAKVVGTLPESKFK